MPHLTDTELPVLLVVLRQTVGRGKGRDWLARSQLVSRTGRSPDAISRAVDGLVQRGLISVEDAAGRPCDTPEARRAERGRLYYRPGKTLLTHSQVVPPNLDRELTANLRVIPNDTTRVNRTESVMSYRVTPLPPALPFKNRVNDPRVGNTAPSWLDGESTPPPDERERIEREKDRIRHTLQRLAQRDSDQAGRAIYRVPEDVKENRP
jgi:hypothetical protein